MDDPFRRGRIQTGYEYDGLRDIRTHRYNAGMVRCRKNRWKRIGASRRDAPEILTPSGLDGVHRDIPELGTEHSEGSPEIHRQVNRNEHLCIIHHQSIPRARIQCVRFSDRKGLVFADSRDMEGDLIDQVTGTMDFITRNLPLSPKIDRLKRHNISGIALEAIKSRCGCGCMSRIPDVICIDHNPHLRRSHRGRITQTASGIRHLRTGLGTFDDTQPSHSIRLQGHLFHRKMWCGHPAHD